MRPFSGLSALPAAPLTLCDIIKRGYLSQVSLLVNLGLNLDPRDDVGRTPLMLTAYVEPEDWGVGVARLLIEADVRMNHRDKFGMNVLHHACIYERVRLVQVLLHAPDFDVTQKDKFGNTALHYAAVSGNVELVKLITAHYRKYRLPIDRHNNQLQTPRDEAVKRRHSDRVDILVDPIPASAQKTGKTQTQDNGNTPVVLTEERTPAGATNKAMDNQTPRSILRRTQTVSIRVNSAAARKERSYRLGENTQNQSLSGLRHTGSKSDESTQKEYLPNIGDNKYIEDVSHDSQKNVDNEMIQITDLEDRPSSTSSQQLRSSSVLKEKSNIQPINGQTLHSHSGSSNFLGSKSSVIQRIRREATVMSGSSSKLLPYEKDPEQIIYVASENDFRNTRDHVLKLTQMTFTPVNTDTDCLPTFLPPPSSVPNDDRGSIKFDRSGTWRDSIRFLYQHYEYQWSASWRKSAKPPPPPSSFSGTGEEKEEQKDKKQRHGGRQGTQVCEQSPHSKLRKPFASKRKTSNSSVLAAVSRMAFSDATADSSGTSTAMANASSSNTPVWQMTRRKSDAKSFSQGQASDRATTQLNSLKAIVDRRNSSSLDSQNRKSPSPENNSKVPNPDTNTNTNTNSKTTTRANRQNNHSGIISPGSSSGITSPGNSNGVISSGSGNGAMTQDRSFRLGASKSYTVPAVTKTLVDGDTDAREMNAEPTDIDTNKLTVDVISDVDDADDDDSDICLTI